MSLSGFNWPVIDPILLAAAGVFCLLVAAWNVLLVLRIRDLETDLDAVRMDRDDWRDQWIRLDAQRRRARLRFVPEKPEEQKARLARLDAEQRRLNPTPICQFDLPASRTQNGVHS